MNHYVYKLTDKITKEFYFGSRSCECDVSVDNYLGSMRTWRPKKINLVKEILRSDFKSRNECMKFERDVILFHYKDKLNRNYHIPGIGFETTGTVLVKDNETGKCFRVKKDDVLLTSGKVNLFWKGRSHTTKSKRKMSKSALTRKTTIEGETQRIAGISKNNQKPKSEEHRQNISKSKLGKNNPMYGKISHMNGKHYERVSCPHCGKEVAETKINLFHNDNCKLKSK